MSQGTTPPGWYYAEGDPPNTQRYWDGNQWIGEPQTLSPSTGVPGMAYTPATGPELASPGSRFGARFIDIILLFIVSVVWFLVARAFGVGPDFQGFFESFEEGTPNAELLQVGGWYTAASYLFVFLWDSLWTAFAGGTPGKLIVGARVADATSQQSPPSPILALRRALHRLLPVLGLVALRPIFDVLSFLIAIVSLVLLFADDKHRTVMDRVGGTIVVKKQ